MKSSARTHGERRPPGRPGQAGWQADGGGERGRTTRGAGAQGAEHARERPQGRALREADGGDEGRAEEQGRRGGGGTRRGGHARKGSPGCPGVSPAVEGAGPGNSARGACAVGLARATRRCSGQPCVLNVPVSSCEHREWRRLKFRPARGREGGAGSSGFPLGGPGPRDLSGAPRGPFVLGRLLPRYSAGGGGGWGTADPEAGLDRCTPLL